jgi:branched-chain amino acid transport system permease protein
VTLIYGILRFSNFAHGDTMAFGAMVTILMTWFLQAMGHQHRPAADRASRPAGRHRGDGAAASGTDRAVYRFYRRRRLRR